MCQPPPHGIAGAYGTCQHDRQPVKHTFTSNQGGKCGDGDSPWMDSYKCAYGLMCQPPPHGIAGAYGTCQHDRQPVKHTFTSNQGGRCGDGDSPWMDSYKCADGLMCQPPPHGIDGAYGTCVFQNWIPDTRFTVGQGEFCGHAGGRVVYVCDATLLLECTHGTCQLNLGPYRPVIHSGRTSPLGGICGSVSGTGSWTCQTGLYCLGYVQNSGVYGSCQSNGRRLESLDAPELKAPLNELEAPLAD